MIGRKNIKYSAAIITTFMLLVSISTFTTAVDEKHEEDEREYTHTVMVEVGTATWCPSCPAANTFWHNTYETGDYDFEYTEMVIDVNTVADNYMQTHYNIYWVPSSYIDGFYQDESTYLLDQAGAVEVYDIDLEISKCQWLDTAEIDIEVRIDNNEASTYDGTLRVYVIEKTSTLWDDNNGNDYWHAFLDFAIDEEISISASGSYSTSTIWDGSSTYPGLDIDNCQVIAVVANDEAVEDHSDPPSGAPFYAYQVDETTAVDPVDNLAPTAGFTYSPSSPNTDDVIQFTDTSIDNDGTIVSRDWDFDDGNFSTATNPTHNYSASGVYMVSLTVEDDDGATNTYTEPIIVAPAGMVADVAQPLYDRGFRVMPGWDGAQEFVPSLSALTCVDLYMTEWGSPWGPTVVQICEDSPDGTVVFSDVIDPADVPSYPTFDWVTVDIGITVDVGEKYCVVLRDGDDGDEHNTLMWGWCDSYGGEGPYPDGKFLFRKLDFPNWFPIHDWDFTLLTYS